MIEKGLSRFGNCNQVDGIGCMEQRQVSKNRISNPPCSPDLCVVNAGLGDSS